MHAVFLDLFDLFDCKYHYYCFICFISSQSQYSIMIRSFAANALRQAARRSAVRTFAATAGGSQVDALASANPNLDVVRYEHKNITWTTRHVQYYSESLAIGFLEMGFTAGDVVLSWMPEHFSEQVSVSLCVCVDASSVPSPGYYVHLLYEHPFGLNILFVFFDTQMVLQFACSKAGLVLYTLDHLVAKKDSAKAEQALKAALELTKANILIAPEATNDVNYVNLVHKVIPELRIFDTSTGAPFVTPRFPNLRVAVHTGFDQDDKYGWFPLRHMVVPSQNLDSFVGSAPPSDKTPLAGVLKVHDDMPVGVDKPLTNAQVVERNVWPTYCSILQKKFHTVEGVGVIF